MSVRFSRATKGCFCDGGYLINHIKSAFREGTRFRWKPSANFLFGMTMKYLRKLAEQFEHSRSEYGNSLKAELLFSLLRLGPEERSGLMSDLDAIKTNGQIAEASAIVKEIALPGTRYLQGEGKAEQIKATIDVLNDLSESWPEHFDDIIDMADTYLESPRDIKYWSQGDGSEGGMEHIRRFSEACDAQTFASYGESLRAVLYVCASRLAPDEASGLLSELKSIETDAHLAQAVASFGHQAGWGYLDSTRNVEQIAVTIEVLEDLIKDWPKADGAVETRAEELLKTTADFDYWRRYAVPFETKFSRVFGAGIVEVHPDTPLKYLRRFVSQMGQDIDIEFGESLRAEVFSSAVYLSPQEVRGLLAELKELNTDKQIAEASRAIREIQHTGYLLSTRNAEEIAISIEVLEGLLNDWPRDYIEVDRRAYELLETTRDIDYWKEHEGELPEEFHPPFYLSVVVNNDLD